MLSWLGAAKKGADAIAEEVDRGPTFGELALRWWEGIESGSIGKRKGGGGAGYSETTLKGYERTLRKRGLNPITLHECRHTYASFLMAAGYTLKELMAYMGHADLQMVSRYVKLLP